MRSVFYFYQKPPPQKLAPTMIKSINKTTIKAKPPPADPNIKSLLICFKEILTWVNSCYVPHRLMTQFI